MAPPSKLTALKVKHAPPGRHGDGDGLQLLVKPSGSKSWVLRVQYQGRRKDIGLGSLSDLTLAEAREKAAQLRKLARQGKNPRAERDRSKQFIPTFAEATRLAHAELSKGWSEKTGDAFKATLAAHALPALGEIRVSDVTTAEVIAALSPIWTDKPQQARKVRLRIMQVLAFARSNGWRAAPLPEARDLSRGLAKQPRGKNFAAMAFAEVPGFVAGQLGQTASPARLALLFAVVTAARSGEVRAAQWQHIDLAARNWTRPAELMKSDRAHTVTLSEAALALLGRAAALTGKGGYVFPSMRSGTMLSDMALSAMLRASGQAVTVHGFRSSFRDWAAEMMPAVPAMVAEMALAHSVGTATEQAYLRSDLRALRFRMLDAWGAFVAPSLSPQDSNVVQLGAR